VKDKEAKRYKSTFTNAGFTPISRDTQQQQQFANPGPNSNPTKYTQAVPPPPPTTTNTVSIQTISPPSKPSRKTSWFELSDKGRYTYENLQDELRKSIQDTLIELKYNKVHPYHLLSQCSTLTLHFSSFFLKSVCLWLPDVMWLHLVTDIPCPRCKKPDYVKRVRFQDYKRRGVLENDICYIISHRYQ
jgi:hypothetical protein